MDILYVIGNRLSEWYNNELRYSLRCLERNGVNIGRVFIAGYKPPFVNDKAVIFVPCKDKTNIKHYNIQACIDEVVRTTDIGENDNGEFLYSSDDHFYIRPTDFAAYPYYWRGVMLPEKANNDYHRTLLSTRELLSLCKLPTLHLAWHGNTHFNARVWRSNEFQLMLSYALTMPEGCEPTCLMLNYMLGNGMLEMEQFVQREDCKFGANVTDVDIQAALASREVVSATDNIERSAFGRWLQNNYKHKSKFEQL